jgi:2-amino-4-hydroxy-6-hydroxymethyldihydropteridine diphosphokinase
MVRVAISLGSNLGDRRAHLASGVQDLEKLLSNLKASDVIETEPQDVPEPQPPYLNMAVVGETSLDPEALIAELLRIEKRAGRERRSPKAARTLDLDVILYGDQVITTRAVIVPHPRFRGRRFVLAPLAEIAPEWIDPVTGRTVGELLDEVEQEKPGA